MFTACKGFFIYDGNVFTKGQCYGYLIYELIIGAAC